MASMQTMYVTKRRQESLHVITILWALVIFLLSSCIFVLFVIKLFQINKNINKLQYMTNRKKEKYLLYFYALGIQFWYHDSIARL